MKAASIFVGLLFSVLSIGAWATRADKYKTTSESTTFAAGRFWGVAEFYRKIPGVIATRVGFVGGGDKPRPTFEEVQKGDTGFIESVDLRFEPKEVSYEKLVEIFFKIHDPTQVDQQGDFKGSQFRSVIFYHNDQQKKTAEKVLAKVKRSKAWKGEIKTEIQKIGSFYVADEAHQKYLEKNQNVPNTHRMREISFEKTAK
jgi:peptide-methionine (S)-S-oxide reductase